MNAAAFAADALRALDAHPGWFALLKGSLVLALACGVHALAARAPAALRHAVLLCGIGGRNFRDSQLFKTCQLFKLPI